jgi:hypothetical protein
MRFVFKKRIEYFSINGGTIPNGHPLQRAGFIRECIDNSKKMLFGSILFYDIDKTLLENYLRSKSINYKIENSFKGKYIHNNKLFDSESISIELIDYFTHKELIRISKQIVKDLNTEVIIKTNHGIFSLYLKKFI